MRSRRSGTVGIWWTLVLLASACGDAKAPSTTATKQAAPETPPAVLVAPSAPPSAVSAAPAPDATSETPVPPEPPKPDLVLEKPKLLSDAWYRTLEDGQPSGWKHVRWTR